MSRVKINYEKPSPIESVEIKCGSSDLDVLRVVPRKYYVYAQANHDGDVKVDFEFGKKDLKDFIAALTEVVDSLEDE